MRIGKIPVVALHDDVATPDKSDFVFIYQLSTDQAVYGKKSDGTHFGLASGQIKGSIDCSTNPNYPAAEAGDTYRVSVAGLIGGGAGVDAQVGDMIVCYVAGVAGTQAAVGANWAIEQGNLVKALLADAVDGVDPDMYITPETLAYALRMSMQNVAIQSGGTANDILADTVPAILQFTTGVEFVLIKTSAANTGASTVNINGGGVINIKKMGVDGAYKDLIAGDMPPGVYKLIYRYSGGAGRFILQNPVNAEINVAGGIDHVEVINAQTFTWTKGILTSVI